MMFLGNMKESRQKEITIGDITFQSLEAILKCIRFIFFFFLAPIF